MDLFMSIDGIIFHKNVTFKKRRTKICVAITTSFKFASRQLQKLEELGY
jgi:hypothetical protein